MPFDRFMIAPINSGLTRDAKPWLIPDDAFERLNNAYVFRGRVRKRFGSYPMNMTVDPSVEQLYTRLRINIGTTDAMGDLSTTVPGTVFKVGQLFSIGDEIFTVSVTGNPAVMLDTGAATTKTYDTTTGAVIFVGADALTDVYFYPSEPVMGLITYETSNVNNEPTFAFDTQFAYQFVNAAWERLSAGGASALWTGTDSQFHWGYTFRGIENYDNYLFVTNFNAADNIRYWDNASWNTLNPAFNAAGDTIETARIVIPFKDRLILLNTVEKIGGGDQSFINRCRFSQNGSPIAADAWREDTPGKGGYIDAPLKEGIVTAQFLKDRLIVFFESSTWELVYTGNQILPFVWQQINTELGAESTFSVVPFDKVTVGVGNVGIHACNGSNVERIDDKIPDEVFKIHNENEGVERVYGIRDYETEMIYWSFPSEREGLTYPDRVLVYNYKNGSWAFNDDAITAFGYFQPQSYITWNSTNLTWQEYVDTWSAGQFQSRQKAVLAGNQQGYVFIIDPDIARNAPALSISKIVIVGNLISLTVVDHNLSDNDWIIIENAQGVTGLDHVIVQIASLSDSTLLFSLSGVAGTYTGGGTVARMSRIDILTKQYNFYANQNRNVFIQKVDFCVDKTSFGQISVDYFPSSTNFSMVEEGNATNSLLGTSVLETSPYALYPLEQQQDRLWHPVYLQSDGECIQLRIYLSDEQMAEGNVVWSDFQLNAMTFYAMSTSSRME